MPDENHSPTIIFFRDQNINQNDFNTKIMLTAIISLSVVVVLVTIIHIYARFVLRRQAQRQARHIAAIRQLGVEVMEPSRTGLDPLVIASLPIFIFKNTGDTNDDETRTIECAICLSTLENNEIARLLPNCKHVFHSECIVKWLSSQSTCPICRAEAEPRLVPEPREPVAVAVAPGMDSAAALLTSMEGTSESERGAQSSAKIGGGSISRLSSFRRMLSRQRSSSQRTQSCENGQEDVERQ